LASMSPAVYQNDGNNQLFSNLLIRFADKSYPLSLTEAITALKAGRFVLVHDDKGRENEVDMVVAAEQVKPHHIATMRNDAGGLVCLAIANEITTKLGLVYMHDMIAGMGKVNPVFSRLTEGKAAYGDKPSFSISVNHRSTYTGITDHDRALTILIASKRLLRDRMGHTELCVYLMQLAGLTPAVAICEMMDSATHMALCIEAAKEYATKFNIPLIDASELKAHARVA